MLGMRRTMFVVADELAPVVQAACTRAVAVQLRRRYEQILEQTGVTADAVSYMREVEAATLAALELRREATAQELGQDVPALKTQVRLAQGKSYEGVQSIATWIHEPRRRQDRPRASARLVDQQPVSLGAAQQRRHRLQPARGHRSRR
jgi:hypothetical protein